MSKNQPQVREKIKNQNAQERNFQENFLNILNKKRPRLSVSQPKKALA